MKHMKKNDGYVLVYVMITFVILSFAAVSICSMAVKNLQAQKASIQRMEARYTAEGYLQQFVAEITSQSFSGYGEDPGTSGEALAAAQAAAKDELFDTADGKDIADKLTVDVNRNENLLLLQATAGSVTVSANMKVNLAWESPTTGGSAEAPPYTCTIATNQVTLTYDSYDISYSEGGGD